MMSLANRINDMVKNINKPLKLAVMGCVVNGPGEAKHADLGIAGGDGKAVVFEKGQVVYTASIDEAERYFVDKVNQKLNQI
jgi:(E)-4-hydroxy-3-methylbut-2-enyl-diphosphate synthase